LLTIFISGFQGVKRLISEYAGNESVKCFLCWRVAYDLLRRGSYTKLVPCFAITVLRGL